MNGLCCGLYKSLYYDYLDVYHKKIMYSPGGGGGQISVKTCTLLKSFSQQNRGIFCPCVSLDSVGGSENEYIEF